MTTNRTSDQAARWMFTATAAATIVIVVLIFVFLFREAAPFLKVPGVTSLFHSRWLPVAFQDVQYGVIPLITGTALVTVLAGIFAVPLGIAGAIYIAEVARPAEREILKPFIELLAGIPSVVLGFFGLVVVAPAIKAAFGLPTGMSALTGAVVLALMAIPTIISVSEDAIRAVPRAYRDASLALGASPQQTVWRVVTPAAIPGITAAVMLGFGRIIGETMAVLMVTGNTPRITFSPFDPVRTMTATIAAEMGEVSHGDTHYQALFCIGVLLLFTTFFLNLLALQTFKRYGARH
jgi:phosphate transport system permease protein